MDDAALVRRLAIEKLEAKGQELRSSWAWARPMLDPDYGFTAEYRRVHPKSDPLPREIAGELARVEQRLAELDDPCGGRLDRRACGRSRAARGTALGARSRGRCSGGLLG
jgi:hypothetical protein